MFRHRRIQVSLICFALFLAVIVLWVRSYSWAERVFVAKGTTSFQVISVLGKVIVIFQDLPGDSVNFSFRLTNEQLIKQMKDSFDLFQKDNCSHFLGFVALWLSNSMIYIGVPYWFISIFFALLCGLPWYKRRFNFSLRTFFIAFTVLAVLLGFAGWVFR
jgi:hypothetical protein